MADPSLYAAYIIQAYGERHRDCLCFEEYCCVMSSLCRGSADDRLKTVFRLIDTDRDGLLSPHDWHR